MRMNNIIIGTAGHVDHGKTLLIKALTGIETDRLAEEKKRGITIELGFAYLDLPNGQKAGIIDVPGHEKFIKNMLAGAGSIDLAMLVIAADEGIMPQTREHLAILNLLNIKHGLVCLNKVDLVEDEWRDMVILDIQEELRGSFLENADILPVSAYTGQGIAELKESIFRILENTEGKPIHLPFRMPIDRVFTMEGFGTVATGTLIEGQIALGCDITVYPNNLQTKARRIQVHGNEADVAYAGSRVAVNLPGLKTSDVHRGDVLAAPNSIEENQVFDIYLQILEDCEWDIVNNSRLHMYHGTADVLCRLSLFGKAALRAGETAYAQLRLAEPVAAKAGDRFVLRFYSPIHTVGGGIILDHLAKKVRWGKSDAEEQISIKHQGNLEERIEVFFLEKSHKHPSINFINQQYFANHDISEAIATLTKKKLLYPVGSGFVHAKYAEELGVRAQNIARQFHKANPLTPGLPAKEMSFRLMPHNAAAAAEILPLLIQLGCIKKDAESNYALVDFVPKIDGGQKVAETYILETLLEAGHQIPSIEEIKENFGKKHPKHIREYDVVVKALVRDKQLIMLDSKLFAHKENFDEALSVFKALANEKGEVLLSDFRDTIQTSRKFAMAYLEYFDKVGISKRVGDGRKLL